MFKVSLLLLCTLLGVCSAAVVYNVKPVSREVPVNNDASDLEPAESAQFGFGGFGSPYGYGGYDNFGGGYGGYGGGYNNFGGGYGGYGGGYGGYGGGYDGFGGGGHHHHHHHG